MEKREFVKDFLSNNKGYLKWGAGKLARLLGTTPKVIKEVRDEIKHTYEYYGNNRKPQPKNSFKRLFFDIETSFDIGWFWRSGYNQTITTDQILHERGVICVSWKWEFDDKVYNLRWDENNCDKKLLEEFSKVMLEADEVIAHNGDRFDIKWLRTRCLIHRVAFPTYVKSLDTLKKVKSMFNFQSNKLDYIAGLLGFGHKLPTGIDLWKQITLNKCKKSMAQMIEYCNHDVVLLEDVYHAIQSYIKPETHVGRHLGRDKCSCPNCGGNSVKHIKDVFTSTGTIKRQMACNSCGSDYMVSNRAFKKRYN